MARIIKNVFLQISAMNSNRLRLSKVQVTLYYNCEFSNSKDRFPPRRRSTISSYILAFMCEFSGLNNTKTNK